MKTKVRGLVTTVAFAPGAETALTVIIDHCDPPTPDPAMPKLPLFITYVTRVHPDGEEESNHREIGPPPLALWLHLNHAKVEAEYDSETFEATEALFMSLEPPPAKDGEDD